MKNATQTHRNAGRGPAPEGTPDVGLEGGASAVAAITGELRALLADAFALYLKTRNFHWHVSGPHFRDYHLLLDEQADQLLAITDEIAERARKIGGTTLRSIGDIGRHQRLKDNDEESVGARDMLMELCADNQHLARLLTAAHGICDEHKDIATASMIEIWVDQAQRRAWFLARAVRA